MFFVPTETSPVREAKISAILTHTKVTKNKHNLVALSVNLPNDVPQASA